MISYLPEEGTVTWMLYLLIYFLSSPETSALSLIYTALYS